ncbi:Sphingosine kinase 1, partial [Tieghemiomyces parasiticus]
MPNNHLLLHSGTVELCSTTGRLKGLLSVDTDSLVFKDQSKVKSLLTGRNLASAAHQVVPIPLYSVLGASLSRPPRIRAKSFADAVPLLETTTSNHFTVFTLAFRKGKRPQFETWTFRCESNEQAKYWADVVHAASRGCRVGDVLPTRRVCVLANPYGGTSKALQHYERTVKPMFALARMESELKESTHADFAYEFGQSVGLKEYAAIVTLSGDGLLHMLINGIMSRLDWRDAIKIPLGIIPGGTCNGLAKSIDVGSVEAATLAVIKGRTHATDVMAVSRPDGSVTYGHLNMLWGIIADMDIESEKLRWAGSLRMNIWGVVRLLQLRRYQGRLHILPADVTALGQVPGAEPIRSALHEVPARFALPEINFTDDNSTKFSSHIFDYTGLSGSVSSTAGLSSAADTAGSSGPARVRRAQSKPRGHTSPYLHLPGLNPQPTGDYAPDVVFPVGGQLPAPWETFEGPFIQVTAANVPWIASDMIVSPHARLNDGTFEVVWMDNLPRTKLMQYFLDSETSSQQLNKGHYHYRKARAIILEPLGRKVGAPVPSRIGSGWTTPAPAVAEREPLLETTSLVVNAAPGRSADADEGAGERSTSDAEAAASPGRIRFAQYVKRAASMRTPTQPQTWRSRFSLHSTCSPKSDTEDEPESGETLRGAAASYYRRLFSPGTREVTSPDTSAAEIITTPPPHSPSMTSPDIPTGQQAKAKNRLSVTLKSMTRTEAAEAADQVGDLPIARSSPLQGISRRSVSSPSLATTPTTAGPARGVTLAVARLNDLAGDMSAKPTTTAPTNHFHPGILDIDGEEVPCGPVKLECIPGLLTLIIPPWFSETKYHQATALSGDVATDQQDFRARPYSTISAGGDPSSPAYTATEGLPVTRPDGQAVDSVLNTAVTTLKVDAQGSASQVSFPDVTTAAVTSPTNKLSAFPSLSRQQKRQENLLRQAHASMV